MIKIFSYIKNYTIIEINEIKEWEENKKDNYDKTLLLEIELFIEQKSIQNNIELYKFIINFEKHYINYIKNLLSSKNNIEEIPCYSLSKKIFVKASEILYNIYISIDKNKSQELLDLIPDLSENIQEISILYQEKSNKLTDTYNFIYNSFSFRSFYFIIEKIIANKILIKKEYILKLYKTILVLDKINNNDIYYDLLDMDNVVEIKNSSLKNISNEGIFKESENLIIPIELKEPKNIIIEKKYSSYINLNDLLYIKITKKNNITYIINLNYEDNYILKDVIKIEVEIINKDEKYLNDFIINIIPLKNEKDYYSKKDNSDYKLLSLMQKTIIYYLLFLFEDFYSQIYKFNTNDIIKEHCQLYETELFNFISFPDNYESFLEKDKEESPVIKKANDLVNKIKKIAGENNTNFDSLNTFLVAEFEKINKDLDKSIDNKTKKGKNIKNINNYDKLLNNYFDYMKKTKRKGKDLTNKIFSIVIKYSNYYDKLETKLKEIKNLKQEKDNEKDEYLKSEKNKEKNDKKGNGKDDLINFIYEKSISLYGLYKSYLKTENKEINEENYLKRLKILDEIIVPSDDNDIKFDKVKFENIINKIIQLFRPKHFNQEEIQEYSQVQNINCQIKLIELLIFFR